jgi:HAD superfamily hydrolase (TIGR01490 family)
MKLALFDLDHTLLPLDSDHAFGEFLVAHGWADAQAFKARNDAFFADYLAGTLDMAAYVEFATSAWRGRTDAEQRALQARFMAEVIQPVIQPQALALIEQHRVQGHALALVTATNEFVTAPIALALGLPVLIATALERDAAGAVTGRIQGVANLREGKVHNVASWLARQGTRWAAVEESWCYSDSTNDLPLLERVTHPVATNPGEGLERIALARGWPILRLFA